MRTANFHESYGGKKIEPPSERSTGLLFAAVAMITAALWRNSPIVFLPALGAAALLTAISLIAPALLKPINIAWFQLGLLLHRVVTPIVMLIVFATVFVPAGTIMRFWYDPLRLKRLERGISTYWIERGKTGSIEGDMTKQF